MSNRIALDDRFDIAPPCSDYGERFNVRSWRGAVTYSHYGQPKLTDTEAAEELGAIGEQLVRIDKDFARFWGRLPAAIRERADALDKDCPFDPGTLAKRFKELSDTILDEVEQKEMEEDVDLSSGPSP